MTCHVTSSPRGPRMNLAWKDPGNIGRDTPLPEETFWGDTLSRVEQFERSFSRCGAMTSHVIILPKHLPVIRRKKLSVSDAAAARAAARTKQRTASPVVRPVEPRRSPSTSSLSSVASNLSDLDAQVYWGPIVSRTPSSLE